MKRILYDLCCGGGGVARCALVMGFRVIGVDHEPQPDYPGEFILADALDPPLRPSADLVWVSPYCQGYSPLVYLKPETTKPRQVNQFREVAKSLGKHYVIENSNTCYDLVDPVKLCGYMFGVRMIRHRKFECSFTVPQLKHVTHYGRHLETAGHMNCSLKDAQVAMGLVGMSRKALSQAVPYMYTNYILTWYLATH